MNTTPSAPDSRGSAWIIPAMLILSAVLLALGAVHTPDTQPLTLESSESSR